MTRPRPSPDFIWRPAPPQTKLGRLAGLLPAGLCWVVLTSCCVGLLAILARPLEPRLDVLTPFAGHFLGFGVAAAAALWIDRYRLAVLGLGVIATFAAHAAPLWLRLDALALGPGSAHANAGPGADVRAGLKVLAFNVWSQNASPTDVVAAVAASEADIVLLSELDGPIRAILEPLAGLYPYRSACSVPVSCKEIVLSRRPIRASGGSVGTRHRPGLSWAEIELDGDRVVTAVAVHLHRPTLDWAKHTAQADGLIGFLRDLRTPVILGGDLNVTPLSDTFARIVGGAGLVAWGAPLPSWPAFGPVPPQFGIDHILVTGDLAIEAAGVGDAAGSDHRPVWSRIAVRVEDVDGRLRASWLDQGGI